MVTVFYCGTGGERGEKEQGIALSLHNLSIFSDLLDNSSDSLSKFKTNSDKS